jgi:hypothetical protein
VSPESLYGKVEKAMKKFRYTEEQILFALKQGDGQPIADVCRQMGISEATYYVWRKFRRRAAVGSLVCGRWPVIRGCYDLDPFPGLLLR